MSEKKALIAMSGGVDSSVAAFLTKEEGFDCIGGTMRLCDHLLPEPGTAPEDAAAVAHKLGMPFHCFDNTKDFTEHVVEDFIRSYELGLTPNPCVCCNRHLKFGILLQQAQALGCSYIVTGHYAVIRLDAETGRYLLCKAADKAKDQSYVLSCMTQEQLAHTHFPLGALSKDQVRKIAEEQGFVTAKKRDSQDICFIPDGDYRSFMERYTDKTYPGGDYLDQSGNKVGKHTGAVSYTIGQRKGLGLALGAPVYVLSKDMERNTVTVGPDAELFRDTLIAEDWNWIAIPELTAPRKVLARIRYRHTEQPATVYPLADGSAKVVFEQPQRAITPGQTVVLYDGDVVIGGGMIRKVL